MHFVRREEFVILFNCFHKFTICETFHALNLPDLTEIHPCEMGCKNGLITSLYTVTGT